MCVCVFPMTPTTMWLVLLLTFPSPTPPAHYYTLLHATLRCTRTQCTRRMTFLQFLFCSPASALRCPGPHQHTHTHTHPSPRGLHLLHSIAWHGRTSSKNFHLIAAKNGKNKKEKEKEQEKETKRRRKGKKNRKKMKICRWLLFTILRLRRHV